MTLAEQLRAKIARAICCTDGCPVEGGCVFAIDEKGKEADAVITAIHDAGWAIVPREAEIEQRRAGLECKARDDEGEFPPLIDLLDFSGENKAHTVIRAVYAAMIAASLLEAGR